MIRLHGGVVIALAMLALIGCGPNGATIRGTVTLDGKPLSEGTIRFESVEAGSSSAGTGIKEGRYEMLPASELLPGKKQVTIRGVMKTGKQIPAGPPAPPGEMIDEVKQYPARGAVPEPRDAEIKAGENELNFELTTKGSAKGK